jgi:hypothetical protein
MKYSRLYPLFFIPFFLFCVVSCTQNNSATSKETKLVSLEIDHFLKQIKSNTLSKEQKLKYINHSQALAKKANIDSLILKTFNKKAEFYNSNYPDGALTVLKEFEKMANSKKDTLYVAHSFLNFGEYYYNLKQNNLAISYFNKSNILFKESKDSSNVIYSLLMMSEILKEKSDYYDMEAVNTDAIKYISTTQQDYKYNYRNGKRKT